MNSEQPGLIGDQFAALGLALGCVQAGASAEIVRMAVLGELRERGRWLLVFDNAEVPADVTGWLPGGGHVLITSRECRWAEVAVPVEVKVLARADSVKILQERVAGLCEPDANRLADQLGDLPLAVAQAAGFMAETGMPAARYLDLLSAQPEQLLDQAAPGSYPRSLAAATRVIADRLADVDPAAAQLAGLCAFLAPEPIPADFFTAAATELPGELAARVADPLAWPQTVGRLTGQGLARVDQRGIQMHRLTQAILRDRLSPTETAAAHSHIEAVLAASNPHKAADPVSWPQWARLIPHVLAADLTVADNPDARHLAGDACEYLIARGDIRTAHDHAERLSTHWRDRYGADDPDTLKITHYLAWALQEMGRYAEARDLNQDILNRRRRLLGEDHPDTLVSASQLVKDLHGLGELQAARELGQDTLNRRRRVLGTNHRSTLISANNLAAVLHGLGELQAACDLAGDALDRMRCCLGHDHPYTLNAASDLAAVLRELGELQAACELAQEVLDRMRRVLGENHPRTLVYADNLAGVLRELDEADNAR